MLCVCVHGHGGGQGGHSPHRQAVAMAVTWCAAYSSAHLNNAQSHVAL